MFILMLCILTFLTLTWFNFITGILFTEQYISCISFFLPSRPKRCKYKVNYKCVIIFVGAFFTNYLYSMAYKKRLYRKYIVFKSISINNVSIKLKTYQFKLCNYKEDNWCIGGGGGAGAGEGALPHVPPGLVLDLCWGAHSHQHRRHVYCRHPEGFQLEGLASEAPGLGCRPLDSLLDIYVQYIYGQCKAIAFTICRIGWFAPSFLFNILFAN